MLTNQYREEKALVQPIVGPAAYVAMAPETSVDKQAYRQDL